MEASDRNDFVITSQAVRVRASVLRLLADFTASLLVLDPARRPSAKRAIISDSFARVLDAGSPARHTKHRLWTMHSWHRSSATDGTDETGGSSRSPSEPEKGLRRTSAHTWELEGHSGPGCDCLYLFVADACFDSSCFISNRAECKLSTVASWKAPFLATLPPTSGSRPSQFWELNLLKTES